MAKSSFNNGNDKPDQDQARQHEAGNLQSIHEHGHTDQSGSKPYNCISEYKAEHTEGLSRKELIGVYKRVRNRVQRKFDNIYFKEIELLCQAGIYLQEHNRKTFNSEDALKYAGISGRVRIKQRKHLENMADKGYIIRVKHKRGKAGHGYALSETGYRVLKEIDTQFEAVERWTLENKNRRRLEDCVLYLDKISEFLGPFQTAILTPEQQERLKNISI